MIPSKNDSSSMQQNIKNILSYTPSITTVSSYGIYKKFGVSGGLLASTAAAGAGALWNVGKSFYSLGVITKNYLWNETTKEERAALKNAYEVQKNQIASSINQNIQELFTLFTPYIKVKMKQEWIKIAVSTGLTQDLADLLLQAESIDVAIQLLQKIEDEKTKENIALLENFREKFVQLNHLLGQYEQSALQTTYQALFHPLTERILTSKTLQKEDQKQALIQIFTQCGLTPFAEDFTKELLEFPSSTEEPKEREVLKEAPLSPEEPKETSCGPEIPTSKTTPIEKMKTIFSLQKDLKTNFASTEKIEDIPLFKNVDATAFPMAIGYTILTSGLVSEYLRKYPDSDMANWLKTFAKGTTLPTYRNPATHIAGFCRTGAELSAITKLSLPYLGFIGATIHSIPILHSTLTKGKNILSSLTNLSNILAFSALTDIVPSTITKMTNDHVSDYTTTVLCTPAMIMAAMNIGGTVYNRFKAKQAKTEKEKKDLLEKSFQYQYGLQHLGVTAVATIGTLLTQQALGIVEEGLYSLATTADYGPETFIHTKTNSTFSDPKGPEYAAWNEFQQCKNKCEWDYAVKEEEITRTIKEEGSRNYKIGQESINKTSCLEKCIEPSVLKPFPSLEEIQKPTQTIKKVISYYSIPEDHQIYTAHKDLQILSNCARYGTITLPKNETKEPSSSVASLIRSILLKTHPDKNSNHKEATTNLFAEIKHALVANTELCRYWLEKS